MKADSERIIELFSEALALPTAEERTRFLAAACGDDPEARDQIESLLEAGEPAPDFLQLPEQLPQSHSPGMEQWIDPGAE